MEVFRNFFNTNNENFVFINAFIALSSLFFMMFGGGSETERIYYEGKDPGEEYYVENMKFWGKFWFFLAFLCLTVPVVNYIIAIILKYF